MESLLKLGGIAFAGGIAAFAILLLAKPLYDAFTPLAAISSVPTVVFVGLILVVIAIGIFQKLAR